MTAFAAVVRDVFRQARASGLTAALFAVSVIAAAVCLTADFGGPPDQTGGSLTILFGSVHLIDNVCRDVAVRYIQFVLAAVVADTLGVLLALVWTAGFLPSFVDAAAAGVMVAKPPGRATLLLAHFAGVVLFVGVQAVVFVAATAVALGIRTGVWGVTYWLAIPVLLVHFATFYAFSAVLAVTTRSTAGCLVGSILFWVVCWAMNYGRHALAGLDVSQVTAGLIRTSDVAYWVLPKPADFGLILYDALDADRFVTPWVEFRQVQERGMFQPVWSVVSSLAFAATLLAVAIYEFVHEDY
jgi:hypothetical protein